jgi:hypothetical protein
VRAGREALHCPCSLVVEILGCGPPPGALATELVNGHSDDDPLW